MRASQIARIMAFSSDGAFHCQVEYWDSFIRSPHKRRREISDGGVYRFESRPCAHGHGNSNDYRMIKISDENNSEREGDIGEQAVPREAVPDEGGGGGEGEVPVGRDVATAERIRTGGGRGESESASISSLLGPTSTMPSKRFSTQ